MVLKEALRGDPGNVRTTLKVWLIPQVLLYVPMMLFYMTVDMKAFANRQIVAYIRYVLLTVVDEWSMFALMRDQRNHTRNSYGFFIQDDG